VLLLQVNTNFTSSQWKQADALLGRLGLSDTLVQTRDVLHITPASQLFDGGDVGIIVTQGGFKILNALAEREMAVSTGATIAPPLRLKPDEPMGIAIITQVPRIDSAWNTAKALTRTFAQDDLNVAIKSYGSGEVLTASTPSSSSSERQIENLSSLTADPIPNGFALGSAGSYLIAAATSTDVKRVIDVIDGRSPSLGDSIHFRDVVASLAPQTLAFAYVDSKAMVATLHPELLSSIGDIRNGESLEDLAGHGGMTLSASDAGFRLDSVAILADGTDAAAILPMNDQTAMNFARRTPDRAVVFAAGTLPPHFWDGLGPLFALAFAAGQGEIKTNVLPSPQTIGRALSVTTAELGFNPQDDLFALLDQQFYFFSTFPSLIHLEFDGFALIETSDPSRLALTIQNIRDIISTESPKFALTPHTIGSDTLHVYDPIVGDDPTVGMGVLGRQAVFTIGSGLDDYMQSTDDVLADNPQFQEVLTTLPDTYASLVYVDLRPFSRYLTLTDNEGQANVVDVQSGTVEAGAGGWENLLAFAAVTSTNGTSSTGSAILYIKE
jgi:hypothetical protein